MELAAFLQALSTWLAGPAAWWLIDHVTALNTLQPDTKRYVAYGLSGAIAVIAWLGLVWIGQAPYPVNGVEWISKIWLVATASFGLSTLLNAPDLRKYRTDA